MEEILSSEIEKCLKDKNFALIPISILYRIFKKCNKQQISSDLLYDFIIQDIDKFYIFLSFLDLKKLSDEKLNDLHQLFERNNRYSEYLSCNLAYIVELRESKNSFQTKLNTLIQEKFPIQNKLNELEIAKNHFQSQFDTLQQQLIGLNQEKIELNQTISLLQNQLNEVTKENDELKDKINADKIGKIVAKVKSGLVFNAEIRLNDEFDETKSKYIISTTNSNKIGLDEYENGELISLSNQTTVDFAAKPGTYYVRAYIVDNKGNSYELVSNSVTTSGEYIPFDYEGKERQVILYEGNYKLEVWGAQGGNTDGQALCTGLRKGGLGGYSTGILSLSKETKLFAFVGGQGDCATRIEGNASKGAFPDGGGTKTGFWNSTFVPGTGGGSTSFRIKSDSIFARVIVASGGGGAGADCVNCDHGGFGGGTNGCNSYHTGSKGNQGAGTQIGSSPGCGQSAVAGSFGKGDDGQYKNGCNSGGGGGGGWYGGGGGFGDPITNGSGGGGSGWIFTESSYNNWMSGDSSNAKQFLLDSSFYLIEASTFSGDSSFPNINGNANEIGHCGNGYAKITPK